MAIKYLKDKHFRVGKPVDWHIYDGKGRLLVKKGMVIRSEGQIEKLLSLKCFIRMNEDEVEIKAIKVNDALSPFHHIEEVINQLKYIIETIVHKPADMRNRFADQLMELSNSIIDLCNYDLDATIGAIHVSKGHSYTIVHPLHCAILCYVMATKINLIDRRLNSLICAALTMNIGMYELQNKLVKQTSRLTDDQQMELEKHTMKSAVLLRRHGVIDKLWIEIVLQHHERQDGKGYPRQIEGVDFLREAKILGLADRYHAMVSPRQYRDGMSPTEALKQIFQGRGKEVDEKLGAMLIKEMGIFPPGALVKLANDEVAVVTRRGDNRTRPLCKAIMSPDDTRYGQTKARDTGKSEYRIMGLVPPLENFNYDVIDLWDYKLD